MSSMDKIYGVNLEEYCEFHNTTPDKLMDKTKKDLELLHKNIRHLLYVEDRLLDPLVDDIYDAIRKKEKHLKRLKEWSNK